jgi:hypothetical protein
MELEIAIWASASQVWLRLGSEKVTVQVQSALATPLISATILVQWHQRPDQRAKPDHFVACTRQ